MVAAPTSRDNARAHGPFAPRFVRIGRAIGLQIDGRARRLGRKIPDPTSPVAFRCTGEPHAPRLSLSGRRSALPWDRRLSLSSLGRNPMRGLSSGSPRAIGARMASKTTLNYASYFFSRASSFRGRSACAQSILYRFAQLHPGLLASAQASPQKCEGATYHFGYPEDHMECAVTSVTQSAPLGAASFAGLRQDDLSPRESQSCRTSRELRPLNEGYPSINIVGQGPANSRS